MSDKCDPQGNLLEDQIAGIKASMDAERKPVDKPDKLIEELSK